MIFNKEDYKHGKTVSKLADRTKEEGLQAHKDKQDSERCPDILYNRYLTTTKHFDYSFSQNSNVIRIITGKMPEPSNLTKIYDKEDSNINVTAINIARLLKRKFKDPEFIDTIIKNPNTYDIFEGVIPSPRNEKTVYNFLNQEHTSYIREKITDAFIAHAISEVLLETNSLDIKCTQTTHTHTKNAEEITECIFLCHKAVAKKDGDNFVKEEPRALQHKFIAYFVAKGIVDEKDLDRNNLVSGIHVHPIEHWVEKFKDMGVKPYEFIPQKQAVLERY